MRKLLLFFLLLTNAILYGQQQIISGTVLDNKNNTPLSNVSVRVKGTTRGTTTNEAGNFSLSASKGEILQISFIGYGTREMPVGNEKNVTVKLIFAENQLGEVVVTAYGIRREKKSLGYSTQVIQGDEVSQTRRENFFNSLSGRVAGATVTPTSGVPGASSQIILRGATSIGGNNQPLIIVDGVPYDNQTLNQEGLIGGASVTFANRNSDYGNRAMDINPEDIDNITILKGPEATALYGADGASGAIVITTKKGKSGSTAISYDNSFRVEKLYRFPEIQKKYNIGRNGVYDPNALANPHALFGAGGGVNSALGPLMPEGSTIYDNVKNFFQTGFTQQHNLNFEAGNEISTVRLSTNYTDQTGIIPNTGFNKVSVRLSGSTKLINKISLSTSLNYVSSTTDKASKGAGSYMLSLLSWPVTNDVRNYINPNGTRKSFRNITNLALEYDNPFWDVYKNPSQDKVDRLTANFNVGGDVTSWLNLGSVTGIDYYTQTGNFVTHPQSRFGFASNGFYSMYSQTTRNISNVSKATFKKNFTNLTNLFTVGFAFEDNRTNLSSQKGERFYEPDFYSINNTDPLSRDAKSTLSNIRKTRFFGNLVTGYRNLLFLSLAGSREGVSTFMSRVVDKNPFFNYGSASLSFAFSDLSFIKQIPWLDFGKLRISYASTGKGPYSPYVIDYRFVNQITTGGGYAYDVTGNNFGLEPEFSKNLEYGLELKLLDNRIGIDVARYNLRSEKQLLAARASYGTGYVIKWFNGGLVENRGIEIQLNLVPVKSTNFSWESNFNFDRNVGEVIKMPADLPTYYDSDTWVFGMLRSQYFDGAKIGNMAANSLRKNNNGEILISPTSGLPIRDDEFRTVGDRQPDFKLGWINTISYRDFTLSFNLDFRNGGDVFNGTEYYLYLMGMSTKNTVRETPVVIKGVLLDGLENTSTPTKNTIAITPLTNSDFYGISAVTEEDFIENVNWMRLRDLTLQYRISPRVIKRQAIIKSASVFITGTDLLLITNYSGADPSVNANTAANRGFGGAGIDFGSISQPRGINFGCRINL